MDTQTDYLSEAYTRGKEAAEAAATWVVDGNTSEEHIRRVITMLDDGDPEAYDYLPNSPNLSGEWADDPTPNSLAYDILGDTCPQCGNAGTFIEPGIGDGYVECHCSDNDVPPVTHDYRVVEAIADEFERGVDENFTLACEGELRKWVES